MKTEKNFENFAAQDPKILTAPIVILVLLIIFIVFFNPISIVGVGERGVKVTLGKVSPTSYSEGVRPVDLQDEIEIGRAHV